MVNGDATADPRYAGNPLVTDEPNIRFYAGAPLVTLEGHALGALCVIDREPRELSPQREEALSALSRQVMRQLELRRTAALLARSNEQLLAREWELEDYQRRLEAANAQLEADLMTDELTGLRNRRALEQALDAELVRASRQGTPVSVLLVDIDFFKAFNLAYLRTGGDRALRTVAGLLASGTRPYDVVARYDEDQFAILLPEADDRGAARAAERLRRSVETAPWKQQPLTVSVGAATAAAETDAAGLLKAARDALQHAKQSGRNLVRHATRFG
jgi:diguanylate cyclase (GGDEF)-like protein